MKETNKGKSGDNSGWYEKWHASHQHVITHWVIFLVIIFGCYVLLSGQISNWANSLNETGVMISVTNKPNAELILNPQTETVKVGDTFSADIVLDTGGKPVDGVDIYSLHYDPTILKVIDDLPSQKGIQITPGGIMNAAANMVDATSGSIKFGAASAGGTNFIGKGVLATVHFKAVAAGNAYLKFDFQLGSTTDSNAAYRGKDQLTKVVDAIYTVNPK